MGGRGISGSARAKKRLRVRKSMVYELEASSNLCCRRVRQIAGNGEKC